MDARIIEPFVDGSTFDVSYPIDIMISDKDEQPKEEGEEGKEED